MKIENGRRILEIGDRVHCQGITSRVDEIYWQEDWGGSDGIYTEFRDTNGVLRNWKQGIDGGFVLNEITDVPEDVKERVRSYMAENLPAYDNIGVIRGSEHPDDYNLYMVVAKHENGNFAAWTSWKDSTESLNHGHYDIETAIDAWDLLFEYVHRIR